jgi:hypothetical protein
MQGTINMRKLSLFGMTILLMIGLLVGCGGEEEEDRRIIRTVDILDNAVNQQGTQGVATQGIPQTQAYEQTLSAYQTQVGPLPTLTPFVRRSPQPTPTPTDDPINDVLGNIVYTNDWKDDQFTGTDGLIYTLNSFEGKVIVILPMSLACIPCQEQLPYVRETDNQFRNEGRPYDIVYINLNINPRESMDALKEWEATQAFTSVPNSTWISGQASLDFINALNIAFGGGSLDLERTPIIIVDSKGQGHSTANEGVISPSRIRDVLVFYAQPPAPPEPTPINFLG